ncbi:Uncharacterized protein APZ42_002672 [Daphnia magna]|uniref:Secreted protein n=1 Tax=Daphnia magna TaxID=35525 RepID=A0A162C4L9_9CRUS|nr:Uncharacterized protein APZ42_002672 [Daphnia magna]
MGVFVSVVGVHIVSTCLCNTGNNRKKQTFQTGTQKKKHLQRMIPSICPQRTSCSEQAVENGR